MTRYDLINENRRLKAEKNSFFEKLKGKKLERDSIFSMAIYEESIIDDLTRDIESEKAWLNSEYGTLNSIKSKLEDEHEHLSYLKGQLERLYDDKESAYRNKDYSELSSIKADIESIKHRRDDTFSRIDSLKRDRDRQKDYISRMKDMQDERYSKRSSHIEKRKNLLAYAYVLKEECDEIYARISSIKSEIEANDERIKHS